ncbi:hypothetical protein BJV77DRAFT_235898 [Russula vinacea]|nr:hypothetical protein BJV77DRAFT_235898 [Russula vinacea]
MRVVFLAFALLPSAAFAAITITGPSASSYWVQNTSNLISWTYGSGDPSSVDIIVNNSNNQTLNGNFSIARSVPVSQESFTVTDVTLRVGTGYRVLFVDPTTDTQLIAQSSDFEVKAPGTSPAPTASPSTSLQGSGTPSGSSTASGSSASSTSTKKNSAALGLAVDARGLFYACGTIAFGLFFL